MKIPHYSLSFIESSFELPKEWSTMEEKDNLMVVQIKSGTSEYSGVIDRFHGQVGKREIVKVSNMYTCTQMNHFQTCK